MPEPKKSPDPAMERMRRALRVAFNTPPAKPRSKPKVKGKQKR